MEYGWCGDREIRTPPEASSIITSWAFEVGSGLVQTRPRVRNSVMSYAWVAPMRPPPPLASRLCSDDPHGVTPGPADAPDGVLDREPSQGGLRSLIVAELGQHLAGD